MSTDTHEAAVERIARLFSGKGFQTMQEHKIGSSQVDVYTVKDAQPRYAIEVKLGSADEYLPYSAYAEAMQIQSVLPSGAVPVLLTNMAISGSMNALLENSHLPVVTISDPSQFNDQEFITNFEDSMRKIGFGFPTGLKH